METRRYGLNMKTAVVIAAVVVIPVEVGLAVS